MGTPPPPERVETSEDAESDVALQIRLDLEGTVDQW